MPTAKRRRLCLPSEAPTSLRPIPSQRTKTTVRANVPRLATVPIKNAGANTGILRAKGAVVANKTAQLAKKSKTRPNAGQRRDSFSIDHKSKGCGDNFDVLRRHVKDESVDLVYLDPPFNSNAS